MRALSDDPRERADSLHDAIGWTAFPEELWGPLPRVDDPPRVGALFRSDVVHAYPVAGRMSRLVAGRGKRFHSGPAPARNGTSTAVAFTVGGAGVAVVEMSARTRPMRSPFAAHSSTARDSSYVGLPFAKDSSGFHGMPQVHCAIAWPTPPGGGARPRTPTSHLETPPRSRRTGSSQLRPPCVPTRSRRSSGVAASPSSAGRARGRRFCPLRSRVLPSPRSAA